VIQPNAYVYGTPAKQKTPGSKSTPRSGASNDSEFSEPNVESDNDSSSATSAEPEDGPFNLPPSKMKAKAPSRDLRYCGLCAMSHADGPGQCFMTDKSEHLAEFREMLLLHADDEPWEQRVTFSTSRVFNCLTLFFVHLQQAAIIAIDETLYRRGHVSLIQGQPLNLLAKASNLPNNTVPATIQTKRANEVLSSAGPVVTNLIRETQSPISIPNLHQPQPSLKHPSTTENPTQAVAGPSKRPASPLPDREPKKKKSVSSPCLVCGQSLHRVKECPVVAEGPKRSASLL
jgi:chromodomain-helicase-DNA-binding protein 4